MSRKSIERNISYDSVRQLYYVNMDYGLDEDGRRVRTYHTFVSLAQARKALRQFETERDLSRQVLPRAITLDQWLEYWMEEVIRPNRAETTLYGYRKIIDNHLSPALGGHSPPKTLAAGYPKILHHAHEAKRAFSKYRAAASRPALRLSAHGSQAGYPGPLSDGACGAASYDPL